MRLAKFELMLLLGSSCTRRWWSRRRDIRPRISCNQDSGARQ